MQKISRSTLAITLLGVFTGYLFYALWHSEELKVDTPPSKTDKKTIEDLSHNKIIPKLAHNSSKSSLPVPKPLEEIEKQTIKKIDEENVSFQTKEKIDAMTEEVYEALIPEEYEETIEEANLAFEMLDEHVSEVDALLEQEEQEREEHVNLDIENSIEKEIDTLSEKKILENEIEIEIDIDIEQEDINNL